MSTPNKVLSTLASVSGEISLALEVAGVLVPIAKGIVREVRSIATGVETVDYEVLIKMDGAELDAIGKLAVDDLTAINAELVARGFPAIPIAPVSTGDPIPAPAPTGDAPPAHPAKP